jgi:transposase
MKLSELLTLTEAKQHIVMLGIEADKHKCDKCGKNELKKTIALDVDGEVLYYGTTCAAKALHIPNGAMKAHQEIMGWARSFKKDHKISQKERFNAFVEKMKNRGISGRVQSPIDSNVKELTWTSRSTPPSVFKFSFFK